jgi:hypothetical protein
VVQQNAHVVELEEAKAQLRVEHHEQPLTSNYEGLSRDFDDLRTLHDVVVKEKLDLEKMEREKAQRI